MRRLFRIAVVLGALLSVGQSHASAAPKSSIGAPCALIPIQGMVGLSPDLEDSFTATDFRNCLKAAKETGAKTIVLHVNSPGGRVDTKESIIRELLALKAAGVRTVAIIEDAGSAAALICLACSEWYVLPGARLGAAATVLSGRNGTVSFDEALKSDPTLAAKYRSFESAIDEEACRATGRSTDLALAMKSKSATLFYSEGMGFSKERLSGSSIELDGKDTILTLTATQLVQFGLAKSAASLEQAMKGIGRFDPTVTKKLKSEMQKSSKKLHSLLKTSDRLVAEYERIPSGGGNKQTESARESARTSKKAQIDKKIAEIVKMLENP